MSIFSDFLSIFIDEKRFKKQEIKSFSFLEKYRKDLGDLYFDDIFIATSYQNIKDEIEQYKFFSNRSFVGLFSDILRQIFVEQMSNFDKNNITVVGVPMHWTRYFIRGFDHIGYLAKYFSGQNNFKYSSILGVKFTKRQVKLNKDQRLKNRENVYFIKNFSEIPDIVILIDDVVSTGISVNMCSKKLKEIGVKKVFVFALATNKK